MRCEPVVERRVELRISGLVQGVNFRWYTREKALSLGLRGWVKNMADGTVSVVAEGDEKHLEELVEWCRHGPSHARVTSVDIRWGEPSGEADGFGIRF